MTTQPTNIVCDCKIALHDHGTRVMYVRHKCRCEPCTTASRVYNQQLRRRNLYGRSNLVDAQPVREHIEQLQAQGMGWKRIAASADVTYSAVATILYGRGTPGNREYRPPRHQVTRVIAEKLLAVELDLGPSTSVDATGTRRRLAALVAAGWPMSTMADRIGIDHQRIRGCLNDHHRQVTEDTRNRVEAFFRTAVHGPDATVPEASQTRARLYAVSRGWVPALAWDDIDDPDESPDVTALRSRSTAVTATEQRIADLEDLVGFGEELTEETARRAGWPSTDSMLKTLRRLDRYDLIDRLQANSQRDERKRA